MTAPVARALLFALAIAHGVAALAADDAAADEPPELRRVAYVIGADDGGADRVRLKYASSDAANIARVLREIGGVAAGDIRLLQSSSKTDILDGFARLRREVAELRGRGVRVELLVYYSGHSDDQGLLLTGARLGYDQLRAEIKSTPADVHIAILDSCASGAFTRVKGGTKRAAFLADASTRVEGYAFITSSSADEVAQESDRIAASFFTHYLISGLRGGADANRDGKVTLNEAYQFAFAETVSRTESTQAGAQHPAYNMHLAGTGDVVMTDLRATSATLLIAADVHGRLFIRDRGGHLVVELLKVGGRPIELGLGPERYDVTLQRDDELLRASALLRRGQRSQLAAVAFRGSRPERTVSRGLGMRQSRDDAGDSVAVALSIVPPLETHFWHPNPIKRVSLNLLVGSSGGIDGIELGGGINVVRGDVRGMQIAIFGNVLGGSVSGLQITGGANMIGGNVRQVQLAGITNLVDGNVSAVQAAGFVNIAGGDAAHFQAAGIANAVTGEVRGLQAAGIANIDGGLRGVAIAGIANVLTGTADGGVQIAGGTNITIGDVKGGQIAGGANLTTGALEGLQIASAFNGAGSVDGAQIGLVNVAGKVSGVQVGLVNVAEEADVSIGLLTLAKNGRHAIETWTSDIAAANVGVKLGARRTYSLLTVGGNQDRLLVGAGLGVHTPRGRYYIDTDLVAYEEIENGFDLSNDAIAQLRLTVGWPLTSSIAVFAGAAVTGDVTWDGPPRADELSALGGVTIDRGDTRIRISPGLFAGISVF
jgi:hypothetical protein